MSKTIVFVSSNKGKINEVREILAQYGYQLLSLVDLGIEDEIIEDGTTYAENALIKARYLANQYPLVLADDSGLEIRALNNEPGVYTARRYGYDLAWSEKNKLMLADMEGIEDRYARFVSVVAYIDHGQEMTFEGELIGEIALAITGSHGFGYDPIFYLPSHQTSLASISEAEKNKISHRRQALEKFMRYLADEKI